MGGTGENWQRDLFWIPPNEEISPIAPYDAVITAPAGMSENAEDVLIAGTKKNSSWGLLYFESVSAPLPALSFAALWFNTDGHNEKVAGF